MPFVKRLTLTSVILNVCWTFLGSQAGKLFHKDLGGIIIGVGFLIIYSSTYFFYFDKSKKNFHSFLMLTLTIIVIFLTASFIPPFLFINGSSNLSIIGFLTCSSTIAFIGIVAVVGHYTQINNKTTTIIIGSIVTTLIAYGVTKFAPEHINSHNWNKVINPLALGFCIWQVLTTFLIGHSIESTTKPTANKSIEAIGA